MPLRQAKIESCVFLQKECAVLVYIDTLSRNGKFDCDYVRCLPTLIFSLDEGVNWEKSYDPGQGITSKKSFALFFCQSFSVIPLPSSPLPIFQFLYYFVDLSGQYYVCRCVAVCLLCGRVRARALVWIQR